MFALAMKPHKVTLIELISQLVKNPPVMQETPVQFLGLGDPLESGEAVHSNWRKKWQPTAVFVPGEPHEQRNLVGYRLWDREESDRTEVTELVHTRAGTHSNVHRLPWWLRQ